MNEAKCLIKIYGDWGVRYQAEADKALQDLHNNCSYDMKAKFNNCFIIIHSNELVV